MAPKSDETKLRRQSLRTDMRYGICWDLDRFFSGGSGSKEFSQKLSQLSQKIDTLRGFESTKEAFELLKDLQEIDLALAECDSFILCLQAQKTTDECANYLRAEFSALEAKFQQINNRFDAQLARLESNCFDALLNCSEVAQIRFVLEERRMLALKRLSSDQENLITSLAIDGYHSWGELYSSLVNEVKIQFRGEILSFGQAENRLTDPDRNTREEIFFSLEKAWKQKETLFAQVLNHLAGFRLKVYEQRGWSDALAEPLWENRMQKETLEAMWHAVELHKKPLLAFLSTKAKLLHLARLSWYDIEAPLGEERSSFSYDQGVALIVEKFSAFHSRMGQFAEKACSQKWVEAEDRPGKRPGGFCTPFPKTKESRIFMTFSGTRVNLSTLAHELGHAYHNEMVQDLPRFAQHYRMNVAETASTFAEQILSDALLQQAKTKQEKLAVLSDRIERSVAFMMNIHARFLFETKFYQLRKQRFLSAEELCHLMQASQEEAFGGALSKWHPYFWASKLHFYFTGTPFYNFPYTFGYLFSLGLYVEGKKRGAGFAQHYDALLKETGMMTVEALAKKHLGVDLTKPDFWNEASACAVADVEQFLQLID